MTEKQLQHGILNTLKLHGWFAFEIQTQGTYDPIKGIYRANKSRVTGVSDIIAIKSHRVVFVEVKLPTNKKGRLKNGQTDNQIEFEQNIKRQGGEYYLVRSIDDILRIIKGA